MNEHDDAAAPAAASRRGFLKSAVGGGALTAITTYDVFAFTKDTPVPMPSIPNSAGPATALTSANGKVDVLNAARPRIGA